MFFLFRDSENEMTDKQHHHGCILKLLRQSVDDDFRLTHVAPISKHIQIEINLRTNLLAALDHSIEMIFWQFVYNVLKTTTSEMKIVAFRCSIVAS